MEEQLTDLFKEVGAVMSFWLVFDKDTERPKGYSICNYYHPPGSSIPRGSFTSPLKKSGIFSICYY